MYESFVATPCPHGFGNKGHCLKQYRSKACIPEFEENSLGRGRNLLGQSTGMERWEGTVKEGWKYWRTKTNAYQGNTTLHSVGQIRLLLLSSPSWMFTTVILTTMLTSGTTAPAELHLCPPYALAESKHRAVVLSSPVWRFRLHQPVLSMGLSIHHLLANLQLGISRGRVVIWNTGSWLIFTEEKLLLKRKDTWKKKLPGLYMCPYCQLLGAWVRLGCFRHASFSDRFPQTAPTAFLTEPLSLLSNLAESWALVLLIQATLDTFNGKSSQIPPTPCSSAVLHKPLFVYWRSLILSYCLFPVHFSLPPHTKQNQYINAFKHPISQINAGVFVSHCRAALSCLRREKGVHCRKGGFSCVKTGVSVWCEKWNLMVILSNVILSFIATRWSFPRCLH